MNALGEEVEVFEKAQHPQISDHADGEKLLSFPGRSALVIQAVQIRGDIEIDENRYQQQERKAPIPARIEEQASREEPKILESEVMGEQIIPDRNDREKYQECDGVKQHALRSGGYGRVFIS